MNVRHVMDAVHSFSIKNIFYDKMDLRYFLFLCDNLGSLQTSMKKMKIVNDFLHFLTRF